MMGIYPCKEEEEEEEKQGRGDNNRTGEGESNPFLFSFVLARPRSPAARDIDQWVDRATLFYFLSFCAESNRGVPFEANFGRSQSTSHRIENP